MTMHTKRVRHNQLHVLTRGKAPLADRSAAGRLLGSRLLKYRSLDPVVLGIPRGGMPVARAVADTLGVGLDFVCARKLTSPDDPECVVGAVCEDGSSFVADIAQNGGGTNGDDLQRTRLRAMAEVGQCSRHYRMWYPKIPIRQRTVILVDDGAETGETMHAAIWTIMKEHPRAVIAALPTAPQATLDSIARETDFTVCLRTPAFFEGIEANYVDYRPVTDRDVIAALTHRQATDGMMW